VHATKEAEAGGLRVQGQPSLHSKTLSQTKSPKPQNNQQQTKITTKNTEKRFSLNYKVVNKAKTKNMRVTVHSYSKF
jgi:hypothetical protein